jgi:hypothetical protein
MRISRSSTAPKASSAPASAFGLGVVVEHVRMRWSYEICSSSQPRCPLQRGFSTFAGVINCATNRIRLASQNTASCCLLALLLGVGMLQLSTWGLNTMSGSGPRSALEPLKAESLTDPECWYEEPNKTGWPSCRTTCHLESLTGPNDAPTKRGD